MKSWDLETGDAKTIISERPGFKGTSFDWIKMQKKKEKKKTWPDYVQERKSNI